MNEISLTDTLSLVTYTHVIVSSWPVFVKWKQFSLCHLLSLDEVPDEPLSNVSPCSELYNDILLFLGIVFDYFLKLKIK